MRKVGLIIAALVALALNACGSEPEQPPGIGVSRQAIQSLYEQPDIGFTFEPSELADGTPRVIGESPDSIAFLELIGPERDITKATIMAAMPSDDTGAIAMNAAYMLGLLNHLVPNWSGGGDWLAEHFAVAADEGEARTIQGNVDITLTAYKELGMVLLTIERRSGVDELAVLSGSGEQGVSDFTRQVENDIARLHADNQSLVESYEAEIARLHSEYNDWRELESRRYLHAVGDLKDETESVLNGLKSEVEALMGDAVATSVSAAKSEWIEAERLAAQVVAAIDGFDEKADAALDKVDAAGFASAQAKLDSLESRVEALAALQQEIDETVDAVYELCAGEKCGTVINIEAWTTTPATTLNAKRAAFSPDGTSSLTVGDMTLQNHYNHTYAVELEQLDVSPFGRPLAKLPNESDRIVGAYRVRIFEGTGSTETVAVSLHPRLTYSAQYSMVCLDSSRQWGGCLFLRQAAFHEGEGYTVALIRSE